MNRYRQSHKARNTHIAYRKGWARWESYAGDRDAVALAQDADAVADFLTRLADGGLSPSTIRQALAAIAHRLRAEGHPSPAHAVAVQETMQGIARVLAHRPRRVRALNTDEVARMIDACGDSLHGLRSAAMLAIGFSCALRGSEVAGLRCEDLDLESDRPQIVVRSSKTDHSAEGQVVALIPESQCAAVNPIRQVRRWLEAADIQSGFVFQRLATGGRPTGRPCDREDIVRAVKRMTARIGLPAEHYSSHSLRSGFVTEAARSGARLDQIMAVTRHRQANTVLGYIRERDRHAEHAGRAFLCAKEAPAG